MRQPVLLKHHQPQQTILRTSMSSTMRRRIARHMRCLQRRAPKLNRLLLGHEEARKLWPHALVLDALAQSLDIGGKPFSAEHPHTMRIPRWRRRRRSLGTRCAQHALEIRLQPLCTYNIEHAPPLAIVSALGHVRGRPRAVEQHHRSERRTGRGRQRAQRPPGTLASRAAAVGGWNANLRAVARRR